MSELRFRPQTFDKAKLQRRIPRLVLAGGNRAGHSSGHAPQMALGKIVKFGLRKFAEGKSQGSLMVTSQNSIFLALQVISRPLRLLIVNYIGHKPANVHRLAYRGHSTVVRNTAACLNWPFSATASAGCGVLFRSLPRVLGGIRRAVKFESCRRIAIVMSAKLFSSANRVDRMVTNGLRKVSCPFADMDDNRLQGAIPLSFWDHSC